MNTLEKKIKKMLTNQNAGLSDKVQLFQNMNRGTSDPPRYELVLPPLKDEIVCFHLYTKKIMFRQMITLRMRPILGS